MTSKPHKSPPKTAPKSKPKSNWTAAAKAHAIATVVRPEGCLTLPEIMIEMDSGEDKVREHVNALVRSGWAERVPGKMVNAGGAIVNTVYFRLLRES